MERYCARLCWNSYGWEYPAGIAKHIENDSYVTKNGFGHEEWLFNFAWVIDGYQYSFLQPVHKSQERLKGQTIEVLLYSINPNGDRVYVGEISHCEVLTDDQVEFARQTYETAGWTKSMRR